MSWREPSEPVRVGVSRCLLGDKVRHDGQHKRDAFVVDQLGAHVELVGICPEVELGLGTPRPAIHLEEGAAGEGEGAAGDGAGDRPVRLVVVRTGAELTAKMERYARRRAAGLAALGLCGYVFKKDSPSCGLHRVKVYPAGGQGMPRRDGRGMFAAAVVAAHPALPVQDEGRLHDPELRENFIERVFACWRLQALFAGRLRLSELVAFHTAHKLTLMAHWTEGYRQLGRLVAQARALPADELRARYAALFMDTLARQATRGRHTNALLHMLGYLRGKVTPAVQRELVTAVEDYRRGLVPLVVPMTLIAHHARTLEIAYLTEQTYLAPHPKELMLRNHV